MHKYSLAEIVILLFMIIYLIAALVVMATYGSTPTSELPGWVWMFMGRKAL